MGRGQSQSDGALDAPDPTPQNGAMTAATEALIRRYYAAFNAGDTARTLACLADDVRLDLNQGATQHGKAAFAAFCENLHRGFTERRDDTVVMVAADGRRAAAEFTVRGTYKATVEGLPPATGQTYVLPVGTFFAIEGGLIVRVTTHYNRRRWLEQIGP